MWRWQLKTCWGCYCCWLVEPAWLWKSPFPEIRNRKGAESSLWTKTIEDFLSWFITQFFIGNSSEWARNSVWMGIFVNEGNFVNEGEICAGCRCVCWRAGIPPCPPLNTAANALCTYTCPNAPKVPITWSMHDRYTALHLYWRFKRTLWEIKEHYFAEHTKRKWALFL